MAGFQLTLHGRIWVTPEGCGDGVACAVSMVSEAASSSTSALSTTLRHAKTGLNAYSRMVIGLKNFGRTRANNVRCSIRIIIPGVPESVPPRKPFILGPGASQSVTFSRFGEILTKETSDLILSGKIDLKFAGTVTYEDIFNESHTVNYQGLLDPLTGNFFLGDVDPRKGN
jgi:hypothetical protein